MKIIRYVDSADRDKPKTQVYRVYADAPIDRPTSEDVHSVGIAHYDAGCAREILG